MKSTFEKEVKVLSNFSTAVTPGGARPAMIAAGAKSRDLWMVESKSILTIKGFNPRLHDAAYEDHIEFIKRSIIQNGFDLSKPLEVIPDTEGKLWLKDGHTRQIAYDRAVAEGHPAGLLPVVPCDKSVSMLDLTVGLVTSNSGRGLTAYEKSIVVHRLATTYEKTEVEVAALLGISDKYAGQLLALATAPIEVREMVQKGEISASLAIETLMKHKDNTVAVLQAALGKAGGAGAKATKKDTVSPEELKLKREKKLAHRLFAAVELLLNDKEVIEHIDEEVYKELDTILFDRDTE